MKRRLTGLADGPTRRRCVCSKWEAGFGCLTTIAVPLFPIQKLPMSVFRDGFSRTLRLALQECLVVTVLGLCDVPAEAPQMSLEAGPHYVADEQMG